MSEIATTCCIAGGGPAGVMLGYLLARAGVGVVVLEKHADFLRDFRGDTVHPSTLGVLAELGILQDFLQRPHQKLDRMSGMVGDETIRIADLRHLPGPAKFVAVTPQWDFLNFLSEKAEKYQDYRLMMRTEALDLDRDGDRICGVQARGPEGELTVRADLVVAADGRRSLLRTRGGLEVEDLGAPMDVLWLRLPRRPGDETAPLGRLTAGRMMVLIPRGDYFQCAYLIRKGGAEALQREGLDAFKRDIGDVVPLLRDRTMTLTSWDEVKLLTVTVDRLRTWYRSGLLCIGDAAHAMSPVGGVGINLAIQDAVATAGLLWRPLRERRLTKADLAKVQHRREWPTKVTQQAQLFIQKYVIAPTLAGRAPRAGWPAKLLDRVELLQRLPARAVGLGVRPEHVRSPDAGTLRNSA
jgi:2-polyprenyl-6-methoxyphenol hydroxylase-like FAD-dependent oxidoreductase